MGIEPPPQIGRRRDSRLRLMVPGRLITLLGTHKVSVRDISQTGAKMAVPEDVHEGQDGVLEWLGFEAFGAIVWAHDGYAGMAFDDPLPAKVLLATRQTFDSRAFQTDEDLTRAQAADWSLGYKNRPR